jgi:predicted RNA-binding Zn-ribbon protein involved in translation (DUF1610 family)
MTDAEQQAARQAHERSVFELKQAIATHVCPACGASTFTGGERFEHTVTFRSSAGLGGGSVYALWGSCSTCGREVNEREMR